MQATSLARWSLADGASPALRRWDDEFVAHHALSNDTHRLSGTAGRVLELLSLADSLDADELVRGCELEGPALHEVLQALADLDLVRPC